MPNRLKPSNNISKKKVRYIALADELREQIAQGILKPGDRLPSFSQMRARYEAAPLTVDRMYALLEDEGLVVREARRGVFVAQRETQPSINMAIHQHGSALLRP